MNQFIPSRLQKTVQVVRCFEPELVNEMIAKAKENCDFVIVYPHWGTELVKEIQSDQRDLHTLLLMRCRCCDWRASPLSARSRIL